MLTQSLINIFSKEMIGTVITALPIIKAILNYLNKPLDDIDDIYKSQIKHMANSIFHDQNIDKRDTG